MRWLILLLAVGGLLGCGTGSSGSTSDASADAPLDVASDAPLDAGACLLPDSSTSCSSAGFQCCHGVCVNEENDPLNCGGCGIQCAPDRSMCLGHCIAPTCSPACDAGEQCCAVNTAGPPPPPACYPGASCPLGCPDCT